MHHAHSQIHPSNPDVAVAKHGGFAMHVSRMQILFKCLHERQKRLCDVPQISFPNSRDASSLLRSVRLLLGAGGLRPSVMHGTTT